MNLNNYSPFIVKYSLNLSYSYFYIKKLYIYTINNALRNFISS